jgi:hypothetical protein
LQQCLHVSAAACDQKDVDELAADPIDGPIVFEKDLAVLVDTKRCKFI